MNGAGLPGMPIVSSTLPSKVQCRTVWSPSSVSQIVSSGATWTPCGRVNSPSPQVRKQIAVIVEHRDRVLAAVERVNVAPAVDPDRGAVAEHDLVRNFCPVHVDVVGPLASPEPLRHRSLPHHELRFLAMIGRPVDCWNRGIEHR